MASRKAAGKKGPKKRAQRAHSNVFAMFDQDQIAEFKEAFNFVDQNRDGFIDKGCLISEMFSLKTLSNHYPVSWACSLYVDSA